MTKIKETIQIVQYHDGLAKGIAKMWNLSRDSWGGDTRVMTEEQVKKKEANSDNIELYLAMDGEEIAGYCGLSEYKEDTGSLYIPLLNVRPDYHGEKIGKKLVLKALEKTIEMGWPRLDLYTWPGNTKAVPLYKKCGFFWEDRDDVTHLMNFIPQLINTPLLKPVFAELDWYDSSVRPIEVKPDGMKENGFTYYEYSWKNDGKFARVQVERTSRGISLIETDEFLLQIQMADHEIIEQVKQEFQIKFVNKTASPVSFKAAGSGNERVEYKVEKVLMVNDETIISEIVTVNPGEEPSAWKTHPHVSVNVWINGQECELKLGVFPVQPSKIEASYSGNLSFLNKVTSIDLEVKNNLKEDAEITIRIPEAEQVSLNNKEFSMNIPAGGRNTVSVPLTVKKHGFYQPVVEISAIKQDGFELKFEQELSVAFKGLGEKFGGETKDFWHIFNGLCQVKIRKRDLLMIAAKNNRKKQYLAFFPPKLGRPYSNEFTKKKPESVSWEVEDSSILLKIVQDSEEMQGLRLTQMVELYGDGIVQKWVEIENQSKEPHHDVAISSSIYHEQLERTYFPIDGQVIYFSENRFLEFGDIKPSSVTENWYFTESKPEPIGISWSTKTKAEPDGWQFSIEDEIGTLEPGDKSATEQITISIGAFKQWEDFRAFALESSSAEKMVTASELAFELNGVVAGPGSDFSAVLKTHRTSYLDGSLHVSVNEKELYKTVITTEEEKTSHSFGLDPKQFEPLSILEGKFTTAAMTTRLVELVLSPSGGVSYCSSTVAEFSTHEVTNGCITIKTAPNFYPGIFSVNVNGSEWLDTSFPEITAKSWWNPWAGGMKTVPSGLTAFSLMKEKNTAYHVEKLDLQGNTWSGLAVSTEINEHAQWKGVHYVQYYLMLPGVPLLVSFTEVKDNGGKNLSQESWNTDFFVSGTHLTDVSVNMTESQYTSKYRAGIEELPVALKTGSFISSESASERLYFVSDFYSDGPLAYTNKHAQQIMNPHSAMPGKNGMQTAPSFLVFDERALSARLLEKLRRIKF
ncbi:GNAT family N-acetyltransferase [Neobacillus sp. PS3-34]|uniref:GNAT family N-acetyltransferase n=1 Tax=Neobacillus sp. PS3-34 TaxID=3070678 RepID=UPI0027DFD7A2|nr:GNAT family N-acetyltransferase [Neobacillus sp. PS3-34]WML48731.1 GNAT family N-acetyltransferase [Neobacillus sp. PS3-34]